MLRESSGHIVSREKTVFKDVEFTGDLHGRGSVVVRPGRLKVRSGGASYKLTILIGTVVLVGIVFLLMLVYQSPALEGIGVVGVVVALVFLAAILGVRVFLAAIWGIDPERPVVTSKAYDVSPPAGAEGTEGNELRFTSHQPRRDLEEFTLRFEHPADAKRCYEVFAAGNVGGRDVPSPVGRAGNASPPSEGSSAKHVSG
ncbi:MAG: hypothetical protein AMK75_02180 [Planctomycetes bacterium SM23_65]|nr:MAG: hypothetical protein AMK75_02180 [Planctomycetes bacterium SM23_65]